MDGLWGLSASELVARIRAREISAQEATRAALARMDAVNPAINAVVQRDDTAALSAAAEVDRALAAGEDPGVLAGVPVTTKVNVDQAGFATTNGLRMQRDLVARSDNPAVANLRRAGAVIVGRTNTPAFSLRWFCRNSLHGQTLNPRNGALTPGGSSGGAGAAVAAGIGAIGHGTDIAGSIRYPAYACGVHGLKPGFGRVPVYNPSGPDRFLGAQIMAVSGPLARSVADIRLAIEAMAAPDPRDPWHCPAPILGPPVPRRVALCVEPAGMKVAGPVRVALRQAAAALAATGWEVEEQADLPGLREAAEINAYLWMAEMRMTPDAVAQEGDADAVTAFAQMCRTTPEPDAEGLQMAMRRRATLIRKWALFLEDFPLVLCPVSGELPFENNADVASPERFEQVYAAQLIQRGVPTLGLPAMSVATGSVEGCPVGVQLITARFREDVILEAAAVIEEDFGAPVPAEPV